jgi:hypothetical protein
LCIFSSEEGEKDEPTVHGAAPTSTSNTVILSEEHRTAAESSPPPQQNMGTSTPPASPQAPSPKRARTGAGDGHDIVVGGSSAPLLNDVNPFICYFNVSCRILLFVPSFTPYSIVFGIYF